jgi:hypothetical protein
MCFVILIMLYTHTPTLLLQPLQQVCYEVYRSILVWYLLGVAIAMGVFGLFYVWMGATGTSYHQVRIEGIEGI